MRAVVDGLDMGYTDEGQGLPLFFVHGFPFHRGIWQKQVDALRASYRVIAPDLRGFGETEGRPGPVTMSQFAGDLKALLKRLAPGPVVMVGHSMGGYVALAFALQFPEMLRGLVLVATRSGKDSPEGAEARRELAGKVKVQGSRVVVDAMAGKMLAPGNRDPRMVEEMRSVMSSAKPQGVIGALLGMAERPDVTPMLKKIPVPTLVVTGAQDALIPPSESEAMAQAIRGTQLSLIPDAGHLVAFEQPEAFHGLLRKWLE